MKSQLKSNLIYNMLYQILIMAVPFVTTPYVSRVLLPEGVGTFSVSQAIAKYFWLFALLGMMNYGNRAIAKARKNENELNETFSSLFYFQLIVSAMVLILYLLMIITIGFDAYGLVLVCQIPYVLSSLVEVSWFFYGTEQFKFMVKKNTLIKIGTAVLVFVLVKNQQDVWIYAFINSMSLLIGQLVLWPFLLKQVHFVKVDVKHIMTHLKPNLLLFVSVVSVSIYTLLDKVMLDLLANRAQAGYYENAEKLMTLSNGIIGASGAVMLPRISFLVEQKQKDLVKSYLSRSMKYIMILASAIAFGLAGVSKEFTLLFFGEEFRECAVLVAWISFAVFFYSWENILRTQYLLPMGKDQIYVKGTVLAAVMNVLVNLLLIPKYGALGAVIGTVASQMSTSGYQSWCIRKEVPIVQYVLGILPFLIVGECMKVLTSWIGGVFGASLMILVFQITCGALFYCIAAAGVLLATKDELMMKLIRR